MPKLVLNDVLQYVENNIGKFHDSRIAGIKKLKLKTVLSKKNPYLYKAKNVLEADSIVKSIVDAHVSSNEEGIFGNWLEGLAIYINEKVYKGKKSGIIGIDLEFDKNKIRYIVTIKSGPNWGNASQIAKLKSDFIKAKRTLRTSSADVNCVAINGCCYGKNRNPDKGEYFKYCGQQFWEFISGNKNLYTEIIEPLGYRAKEKNEEFMMSYSNLINKFVLEFAENFCNKDGSINWKKLVEYNSGMQFK
ncbi:PmeII family type II restriction endonuclease [soil metagenome]